MAIRIAWRCDNGIAVLLKLFLRKRWLNYDMTSELDKLRVLIVEDEAVVAEQRQWFLEDAGMIVAGPFGNLPDALAGVAMGGFELALIDINLGGEDSYPVVDKLVECCLPFIQLCNMKVLQYYTCLTVTLYANTILYIYPPLTLPSCTILPLQN